MSAPKPTLLVATGNVELNADLRVATFQCAHPNGLLGTYAVQVQWLQLKTLLAAILQIEANSEVKARQQAEGTRPRLVVDPSERTQ